MKRKKLTWKPSVAYFIVTAIDVIMFLLLVIGFLGLMIGVLNSTGGAT